MWPPKSEPLPGYEVTVRRTGATFAKLEVIEIDEREGYSSISEEPHPTQRGFYYELWTKPHRLLAWRRPRLLFRGPGQDPLGLTVEFPADPRHAMHDDQAADFESVVRPLTSESTFFLIVPRFPGKTTLKLYSRVFARLYERNQNEPATLIDLP